MSSNPNRRDSHIPDAFREKHGGGPATCPVCKEDVAGAKLGEHLRTHFSEDADKCKEAGR